MNFPSGIDAHFGIEVGTDSAGYTQIFQFLVDRVAHLHDTLPVRQLPGRILLIPEHAGQFVPGIEQYRRAALAGNVFPDILGGKTQHRCHPTYHRLGNIKRRGLRRTPGHAFCRHGVLAVLDHIQIKAAQIHRAEVMHQLIERMKLVTVIRGHDLLLNLAGAFHRPFVQAEHLFRCDSMLRRVKVPQIGQQIARGIAHAPIGIGGAFENLIGDAYLAAVIGGRHPQAQNVRAQVIDHLLRRHHVALGLGHLLTFGVDRETVSQHCLVGGAVLHGDRGQQRGLEPATMLIGTFQIKIGGGIRIKSQTLMQYRKMRHPRVKPDIERIADLFVVIGLVAQ